MDNIIRRIGKYISELTPSKPLLIRHIIKIAYKLYKLKLHILPDKRLPKSKQFSSQYVASIVTKMVTYAQKSALVSIFTPCELLETFNITPMCAELYSSYLTGMHAEGIFSEIAKQNSVPDTFCSYHKILLGSAYSRVLSNPKIIVNTSLVCDANNITFKELADFYNIPHFYIDVPSIQNNESVKYVAEQFRELKDFLEKFTNRRLDNNLFLNTVARSKKTIELLKRCYEEKKYHSLTNTMTSELYEFYITHIALGTESALRYAQMLYKDIKQQKKTNAIRLLWVHTTPFWQETAQKIFNFNNDCQIVGCDMNYEGLINTDIEDPYQYMASRLVYSIWNSGENRVNSIIKAAKDWQVDGVICFCHWGCKQTLGLSSILKTKLEENGYLTLVINGDGCDRRNSSDEQISTRLNAFMEILRSRK